MEHVSNPICFANITHKIVQKHTEYATLYPIKTAIQRPGSAHMLCPFVGPFAKCRIPHQRLATKKLSFLERHFPRFCDSDYTETAPILTSPSLERATQNTYIIYTRLFYSQKHLPQEYVRLFSYKPSRFAPLHGPYTRGVVDRARNS